jgi:hypothetical protein
MKVMTSLVCAEVKMEALLPASFGIKMAFRLAAQEQRIKH